MPTHTLPFSFPLGLVIVDDDREVVDSLTSAFTRMFPGRALYKAYSGEEAITTISKMPFTFSPLPDLTGYSWTDGGHLESSYSAKGVDGLNQLAKHAKTVGIAIFDYAMAVGKMDGLQFASRISCPGKILLTGQATAMDAINAFNSGLINRYVRKDGIESRQVLKNYILELESLFFAEANREFCDLVGDDVLPFLVDAEAHAALDRVCNLLNPHLISPSLDPAGVFVQSFNGDRNLIIVVSDAEIDSQIQIADIEKDSSVSIESLRNRTHLNISDLPDLPLKMNSQIKTDSMIPMHALSDGYWYAILQLDPAA